MPSGGVAAGRRRTRASGAAWRGSSRCGFGRYQTVRDHLKRLVARRVREEIPSETPRRYRQKRLGARAEPARRMRSTPPPRARIARGRSRARDRTAGARARVVVVARADAGISPCLAPSEISASRRPARAPRAPSSRGAVCSSRAAARGAAARRGRRPPRVVSSARPRSRAAASRRSSSSVCDLHRSTTSSISTPPTRGTRAGSWKRSTAIRSSRRSTSASSSRRRQRARSG